MKYKSKRLWIDREHTKYSTVYLFDTLKGMREWDKNFQIENFQNDSRYFYGKNIRYTSYTKDKKEMNPDSSIILLCEPYAGRNTVAHEIMHAVLWAFNHRPTTKRYPIVIKNVDQEEVLLQQHSYMMKQFYSWFDKF